MKVHTALRRRSARTPHLGLLGRPSPSSVGAARAGFLPRWCDASGVTEEEPGLAVSTVTRVCSGLSVHAQLETVMENSIRLLVTVLPALN